MIKNLVIHIGDPKTGSSTIQEILHQRAWSCDSFSLVPQPEVNATALALSLQPRPDNAEQKARARVRLFTERAEWARSHDADIGVISAEFFGGVDPARLKQTLQEFLPEYLPGVRIISYVRPHAGRLLSGYAQELKAGSYLGQMDAFLPKAVQKPMHKYATRFSRWKEVFGDQFTLRPFARDRLRNGDVAEDFFHILFGGAPFQLKPIGDVNQALALEELAALRQVHRRLHDQGVRPFQRLGLGASLARLLGTHPGRYQTKVQWDQPNAELLRHLFLEDAQRMDAEVWDGPFMVPDLDRMVDQATPVRQQPLMRARLYYDAQVMARLMDLSDTVAALLQARPFAWYHSYLRRYGLRFDRPEDAPDHQAKAHNATQVWALLDEIAFLLVPDQVEQARD